MLLVVIPFAGFGEEVTKIIAKVNNEVITSKDLDNHIKALSHRFSQNESDVPADSDDFRKEILQRLIEDKLILSIAKRDKMAVPSAWVESRVNQMISVYPSRDAFELSLIAEGLNLPLLREKIKEQYLLQQTIEKRVRSEVRVFPQEISRYYKAHKEDFVFPEKYTLWIARVKDENVFKNLMEVVKAEGIRGGRNKFPELFGEVETYKKQLRLELVEAIEEIEEGKYIVKDIEEIIYLIYLEKVTPSRPVSLAEAKEEIRAVLEEEKFQKRFQEWVSKLKKTAVIKVYY